MNAKKHNVTGLTSQEARELLKKYGFNEIKEKEETALARFIKKFVGPIPLMIEAALVLSVLAGKWEDFVIIAILLAVNVSVDFLQEQKAHKALAALKETLSPEALVLRDGVFKSIPARELVPGDVVKIGIGDIVPADCEFVDGAYADVDQSTITGESLPVQKKKGDVLYASSIVHKGSIIARVVRTGRSTFIGRSAALVAKAASEEESNFQKAIFGIGKFLITLSSILVVIVSALLIARGEGLSETIRFALVLAVASIPVALPAVLSVTMAIGASALARKNAIVSHFQSVEDLAGIDRLCIDKTGTLTKSKLEVERPKVYGAFTLEDLFTYAMLASEPVDQSAIERAIFRFAEKRQVDTYAHEFTVDVFVPFDPTRKMTEATAHSGRGTVTVVMGAPQAVMRKIADSQKCTELAADVEAFAQKGYRTLAVAVKGEHGEFVPVGILPIIDPPRDDSREVVASLKQKGVVIKMLTGDNTAIARYIARILGIGERIVDAARLHKIRIRRKHDPTDEDVHLVEEADVFTEVVPEDKYHIVDILQKHGHIVAMTGDGVNDAPALKKADVGIAVSGASPAARAAADVVLLDSGLSVINHAIDYARMIFAKMESYAVFRISETIRIILFITLAIIAFDYSPLSPIMIVMLALLNDIPVMAIAYDNAPVSREPIRWQLRQTLIVASLLGILGLLSSFLLFFWLNMKGFSVAAIQTMLFLKLDVAGHSTLYLTRTGRKHFWERPFPSLKFFLPAFSSRIIGTLIALFGILVEPISLTAVAAIWLYATVWFVVNDQIKVFAYRLFDRFVEREHPRPKLAH